MNQVGFQFEEATAWVIESPYGGYVGDEEEFIENVSEAAKFPTVKSAEIFADTVGMHEYRLCRVCVTREVITYERCE